MNNLILIKLGGSLITDKGTPYTADLPVIRRLAAEITRAAERLPTTSFVIGNGGGSYPHYPAKEYNMSAGITEDRQKRGFCLVEDAAAQLNRIVVRELLEAGINAISCMPSSMMIADNGRLKDFFTAPITAALRTGLTPVLFGDIVYDEIKGAHIFSTEQIFAHLATRLSEAGPRISAIIQAGRVDGVLNGQGAIIPEITRQNYDDVIPHISGVSGFDVTGGMRHKIEESLALADMGVETKLIAGLKEGNLYEAITGGSFIGTVIR